MREFMDYVHSAFYEATGWRRDNSYASLNATSDGTSPFGSRLNILGSMPAGCAMANIRHQPS
jgi:distribution and morphology protein 10